MISSVEKIYKGTEFTYKLIYADETEWSVPHNEENRHYQEILKWVADGNTITDGGGE